MICVNRLVFKYIHIHSITDEVCIMVLNKENHYNDIAFYHQF